MSSRAAATLGTVPPKSSSTVTMTAWATSKVASGPGTASRFVEPRPTEVEISSPALVGERAGVRAGVISEPVFPTDKEVRFFAGWKPAQTENSTATTALIIHHEPRRLLAVEFGGGGLCLFFLLALAMLLAPILPFPREDAIRSGRSWTRPIGGSMDLRTWLF